MVSNHKAYAVPLRYHTVSELQNMKRSDVISILFKKTTMLKDFPITWISAELQMKIVFIHITIVIHN